MSDERQTVDVNIGCGTWLEVIFFVWLIKWLLFS